MKWCKCEGQLGYTILTDMVIYTATLRVNDEQYE